MQYQLHVTHPNPNNRQLRVDFRIARERGGWATRGVLTLFEYELRALIDDLSVSSAVEIVGRHWDIRGIVSVLGGHPRVTTRITHGEGGDAGREPCRRRHE